jgi:ornithine decarboxylase
MWQDGLDAAASLWAAAGANGHALRLLNIGGGFPAFYGLPLPETRAYAAEVMRMVRDRFGPDVAVMAEPGRGLVAEAGVIVAEVLLVARKDPDDLHRWVSLDIGKFSGLAETMDEAIRYQLETRHDDGETGPCILAGPSCDSADVLYERRPVQLPLALAAGDRVRILCTGAYTTSYASVGFNGFPPLDAVFLG